MNAALHTVIPAHPAPVDRAVMPVLIMDALHAVTADTPFNQPDRFDALHRDLLDLLEGFHPDADIDECLFVVGHPMHHIAGREERRDVMLQFFHELHPIRLTAGEIFIGLETR